VYRAEITFELECISMVLGRKTERRSRHTICIRADSIFADLIHCFLAGRSLSLTLSSPPSCPAALPWPSATPWPLLSLVCCWLSSARVCLTLYVETGSSITFQCANKTFTPNKYPLPCVLAS
jgi:hypothetical protein